MARWFAAYCRDLTLEKIVIGPDCYRDGPGPAGLEGVCSAAVKRQGLRRVAQRVQTTGEIVHASQCRDVFCRKHRRQASGVSHPNSDSAASISLPPTVITRIGIGDQS